MTREFHWGLVKVSPGSLSEVLAPPRTAASSARSGSRLTRSQPVQGSAG